MDIKKITGADHPAPKPEKPSSGITSDTSFTDSLKAAVAAGDKSSRIEETSDIDPAKLQEIRRRIDSGHYNRPEVLSRIADELLKKGGQ